jgi:hypothetical protein
VPFVATASSLFERFKPVLKPALGQWPTEQAYLLIPFF